MTNNPQRAQAVFLAALEISDSAARRELLERECIGDDALRRRVEELLSAHDATRGFDAQPSEFVLAATTDSAAVARPGTVLSDRYKLIEAIGEGGMGSVWLAEQKEPVKRKVAVKLIKAGMDSKAVLARFEAERQALAVMDHPHIAKVLDGGTTAQGHPYFVMELVKGIPLTDYCDQVQMAVSQRLELFNQVCSAVQHAHQKGIIHRDLKPSNILVTEYDGKPMCKVIDFGLAKAIQGAHTLTEVSLHTAFGAVVGTPLYMAPEQLGVNALDIDTRADLYALGVILYELLTGSTPIEKQRLKKAALDEIMRIVREEEPAIPSHRLSSSETLPNVAARRHIEPARLTKLVRGDLDWIVMKTLEKDRNRRYETANGLSLDIQRYLAGEAVLAAPPSGIYRLRKFVRKHRGPVIAASLLALSLVGGIIGTSVGFYNARISAIAERDAKLDAQNKQTEAERARGEAETERTAAELARNDAVSQKTRAEAREQEAIDAVRRFGDSVANNDDLKNNPALESLRQTLLQEPLAFFRSLRTRLQSDPDTTPESLARLGQAAFDLGKLTEEIGDKQNAIKAYEHAQAIFDRLARENPTVMEFRSDLAHSHNNIGALLSETGKTADALRALEEALEIRKRLANDSPTAAEFQSDLALSHHNIGALLSRTGQPAEALKAYEQALEIQKRLASEYPTVTRYQSDLARSHNSLGQLLSETGRSAEALTAHEQALEIQKRLAVENPSVTEFQCDLAFGHDSIGSLLGDMGKLAEALQAFQQALEIQKRLASEFSSVTQFQSDLAVSHSKMGMLLRKTGKPAEALVSYEQALEIYKRLARDNPAVTDFQNHLANSHDSMGILFDATDKPTEALQAFEQALEIQKRLASENQTVTRFQSNLARRHHNFGHQLSKTGRSVEALEAFQQALEIQKRLARENPTVTEIQSALAFSHNSMGSLLSSMGQPAEALQAYEQALEIQKRLASENATVTRYQSDVGATLNNISLIAFNSGRFEDAKNSLREAIDFQKRALATNVNDPSYRQFLNKHYTNLLLAADGLLDAELRLEAERGLAELEVSDPSRTKTEERIEAILGGEKEKNSTELITLGTRANETMRYALAVKLWAIAFERYPDLLTEHKKKRGSNAARAAILAAARWGIDDPQPTDEERRELREQALMWLQPEFVALKSEIQSGSEIAKAKSIDELKKWLSDEGFMKVQDENLESAPEPAKSDWKAFWDEVNMITLPAN